MRLTDTYEVTYKCKSLILFANFHRFTWRCMVKTASHKQKNFKSQGALCLEETQKTPSY